MQWISALAGDVRFASRTLARRPVFAIIAVGTLALGIGAATAMFSLVDGILLRPLPYPAPSQLIEVMQSYPEKGLERWTLSQAGLVMYRDRMTSLDALAGHARQGVTLNENGNVERVIAQVVTGDFFKVLGSRPLMGRALDREDDRPHTATVAVLSYGFWQSHFGGDRGILTKTLDLGQPVRIVGVMPQGFSFPTPDVQLYLPLGLDPTRAHPNFITGLGRLKRDATPDQARREATKLMWDWARTAPGMLAPNVEPRQTRMSALVTPLRSAMTGSVARTLGILQASVLLILLIAIANVATLVTSRGASRTRELAMRAALGASRTRIAGQMVTESLVLGAIGGACGVMAAWILVKAITHADVISLPRVEEVSVNGAVLLFAIVLSATSGVLFGLAPVLAVRRLQLRDNLSGDKSSSSGGARALNNVLIVGQVGLSFVLLVSAGLVTKSFERLLQTNLGFEATNVTSISLAVPGQRYFGPNVDRLLTFNENVVTRLNQQPGVTAAAIVFPAVFANDVNTDNYLIEGRAPTTAAGSESQTVQYSITPGFFRALRIPLLYGRDITFADRKETDPVVVVDEALASRYWKGGEAVGKRIRMTGDTTWRTIVGVVGSIRDESVAAAGRPHSYFPYPQFLGGRPNVVIRTAGDPAAAVSAVKRVVSELDSGVPLDNAHPLAAAISQSLQERRVTEILLAGFAAAALVLAACGLYGVMSLYVVNRYREFGIRAAIGAEPGALVKLVLREGVGLAAVGIVLGGLGSLLATSWLRSLLYEVQPHDPTVLLVLSVGLLGVAGVSCYMPARRAAHTDPLIALRSD